jgi:hypothetical protein
VGVDKCEKGDNKLMFPDGGLGEIVLWRKKNPAARGRA